MADTKLTALTALTAVSSDDILYVVDAPGGSPLSRKITVANLFGAIPVATKIDVNSATAFFVEQDGVNDNVLVVDTATPKVTISSALDLTAGALSLYVGGLLFAGNASGFHTIYSAANGFKVKDSTGTIDLLVVNNTGGLTVDQTSISGAVPVLYLDQADTSEEFIKLVGESAADNSMSFADAADLTTPGAIVGWFQIEIDDVASSGGITDGRYWMPFYATPTA